MTTDTTERGLEDLICWDLVGESVVDAENDGSSLNDRAAVFGAGWKMGDSRDYNAEYCVDLMQLTAFLEETQPEVAATLDLDNDSNTRRQFLSRLQGEVNKRGTIEVLRNGINHGPNHIVTMYGRPSEQNPTAREQYARNRFSVTRQLRYSRDNTQLALDLCLFINGLPVATFELKNSLTKQTVADAVEQYKKDRDQREPLFALGRCLVHFALDEHEIEFCTELKGKSSWFLPFNKGWDDGAGNPPNPNGLKTDYLWKEVLTTDGLVEIIENYAQVVESTDDKTRKKTRTQIWPRYHQLDVVRKLLVDVGVNGVGQRYLIQHSAGSGKSNSIAWLAHQLIGIEKQGETVLDSVIVVTDRRVLDRQITATIRQFAQVGAIVGHAANSQDLRFYLRDGKKIIISTVQMFPFVLAGIGDEHRDRKYGIIIDEAHSSQGGRTSASMSVVLGESAGEDDVETLEDEINRIMVSKRMLSNASYFAFTATPKNRTLEIFGSPVEESGGVVRHVPFHSYTMKQAIQEGFIVDVLQHYTPVDSYYKLVTTVEDDPEFDRNRASSKLRRYVENHEHAIRQKAEIMVDHFHEQVIGHGKIGGQARAMVVTSSIERAVNYYHAIRDYLIERKSQYKAIVAFSGEYEYAGRNVTEASLNGFPSNHIANQIQQDPYRFLVCAEKFQTGYDEPLLHTMYVDKPLSGIKAVQTLSRLNRARQGKYDAFVLDFANDTDAIQEAFSDYYRTTILSEETDPNKLHDLQSDLDGYQVYSYEQIDRFVERYLNGAQRQELDPILDVCVENYRRDLDEDGQVDFKGKAKAYLRTYGFLVAILPYTYAPWEKLSIFLNFLVAKLPAPIEDDLSKGILDAIDMDSYRVEKLAMEQIRLPDIDGEVDPVPTAGGGRKTEPEYDRLSSIVQQFNDMFGNIAWGDTDRVTKLITEELPKKVSENVAYQNAMKNSDRQNARIEHDKALLTAVTDLIKDDTELFKQFVDNESFQLWVQEMNFAATYQEREAA